MVATVLSSSAFSSEILHGINYTWFRLNDAQMTQCAHAPASIFWGGGILAQYGSPDVRRVVADQLRSMRQAGFLVIRTLIIGRRPFMDHSEGPITFQSGNLTEAERQNVISFVRAIEAAGYPKLEISFGFLERNAIYCHTHEWGDCFDTSRTEENWRFVSGVAQAALSARSSLSVRFDLLNEGCPSPYMPPRTIENATAYLQTMAARFASSFGSDWLVSCPDSPRAQRLEMLLHLLGERGLVPKFLEIHTYRTDPSVVISSLDAANEMATQIGAELILGEFRYHSAEQSRIIQGLD
jgi:hypothetical protein